MHKAVIAMLVAVGSGLAAMSASSAAPLGGTALGDAAASGDMIELTAGMGGMGGGMGGHGQEREHRNSVFIPDDEPFRVEFDDVTPSVIGLPDEH